MEKNLKQKWKIMYLSTIMKKRGKSFLAKQFFFCRLSLHYFIEAESTLCFYRTFALTNPSTSKILAYQLCSHQKHLWIHLCVPSLISYDWNLLGCDWNLRTTTFLTMTGLKKITDHTIIFEQTEQASFFLEVWLFLYLDNKYLCNQ